MQNYVIIGNSCAAIGAVEAIRSEDQLGKITIISDEPYHVYSRPLITYWLGGKVEEDKMFYRDEDFYERNRVDTRLGERAIGLKTRERKVIMENEDEIPYDKLLIATGGKPFVPPVKGSQYAGVFTFTTWDDAKEIKEFIEVNGVKSPVIVGGGFIGMKSTEAFLELGIKVTIVELADRIMIRAFDETASHLLEERLRREGIEVITNNTVVEILERGQKVNKVILKDGGEIDTDLVIFAIGVIPNSALAENTGIKMNRGILVDRYMRTNIPDIYGAGDCTSAYDLLINDNRTIAIWPTAYRQGKIAGYNMAGIEREYPGSFPMNSVELCGIPTISVGITNPEGRGYEVLQDYDEENLIYKKIILKRNRIVGAIFFGRIERAGIITGLIEDKVDISSFKDNLISEDFGLISLPKEYRKHMVSGVGIEI
jgi:NAD(P)H-nitrite reductase large subunit